MLVGEGGVVGKLRLNKSVVVDRCWVGCESGTKIGTVESAGGREKSLDG